VINGARHTRDLSDPARGPTSWLLRSEHDGAIDQAAYACLKIECKLLPVRRNSMPCTNIQAP
jgi:hypothetical protein